MGDARAASGSREAGPAFELRLGLQRAAQRGEFTEVRAALVDGSPHVRAAAIVVLVRTNVASPQEVHAALADRDPLVRKAVLELGSRLPALDLRPMLGDPDPSVVEVACFAIGELGDVDATTDLAALVDENPDPLVREAAVAALGALGDPRGLEAVLGALDGPPALRRRSVVALAAFEGPAVEAALRARLADRDWQVRQVAEEILGVDPSA